MLQTSYSFDGSHARKFGLPSFSGLVVLQGCQAVSTESQVPVSPGVKVGIWVTDNPTGDSNQCVCWMVLRLAQENTLNLHNILRG